MSSKRRGVSIVLMVLSAHHSSEFANRAFATCEASQLTPAELIDSLALSVATNGDRAVLGAYRATSNGIENAGKAFVFRLEDGVWTEEAVLVASDATANDFFGYAVSIYGEYVVVGAREGWGEGDGKAYVFVREGSAWVEHQKLTAWDGGSPWSRFGDAVAIGSEYLAVGARGDGGAKPGKVYMYKLDGASWVPAQLLVPQDSSDQEHFGAVLSMQGNELAILAARTSSSSAAFLFSLESGDWSQSAKFVANRITNLAFDGGRIVVNSIDGNNAEVFVFERQGDDWIGPSLLPKPVGVIGGAIGYGWSLALSGDIVLVGAPFAWLRQLDSCGSYCQNAGGVFYYTYSQGAWSEPILLTPSDYGCGKQFGRSLAISEGFAFAQGYVLNLTPSIDCNNNGVDDACELTGSSFALRGNDCNMNGIPDECDITSGFSEDCNGNGVPDECDLDAGASSDCNKNGIPDECDIATGTSVDCNANGVPDECDIDCNGNGIPDDCENFLPCIVPTACELDRFRKESNSTQFGYSISIGGGFALVGQPKGDCYSSNCDSARAFAYRLDSAVWHYDGELIPGVLNEDYGRSVSVYGATGFVSQSSVESLVFDRTAWGWVEQAVLPMKVLAFDGQRAVGRGDKGAIVYRRDSGTWVQEAILVPPSVSPEISSMAIEGDTLAIGTMLDYAESTGEQDGAVHVFRFDAGEWSHAAKLVPFDVPDCVPGRGFGFAVDVSGGVIAVGEDRNGLIDPALVFIFREEGSGWVPEANLAIEPRDQASVAIEGDTLIVGRHYGGALRYQRIQGEWQGPLSLFHTETGDDFYSMRVAIDDGVALVGGLRSKEVRFFGVGDDCDYSGSADICQWRSDGAPVVCAEVLCNGGSNHGLSCTHDGDCPGGECGGSSRYLSLFADVLSLLQDDEEQTIRVRISSMPLFPDREGEIWWAGPAVAIPNVPHPSLAGAPLICESWPSHAQVWNAGVVSIFGSVIVPGASYEVSLCNELGTDCSVAFTFRTGKWGDVVAPFGGQSQPDIMDIVSLVNKFQGLPSAPAMPRVDLVGATGSDGANYPDHVVSISDIAAGVNAFQGLGFPFAVPACPSQD